MSASANPESVALQPMPEVLLPEDEEFLQPDCAEPTTQAYLASVGEGEDAQHFSVTIEDRERLLEVGGGITVARSTRFSVSGPERFKGNGEATHTADSAYSVFEKPESRPPRTPEQKEQIVRQLIACMLDVQ